MKTVNIQAAKTHLSRLVEEAARGEEIVVAKAGKPMVRLVPFGQRREARRGGQFAGRVWEAQDCWTAGEDLLGAIEEDPLLRVESERMAPEAPEAP